MAIDRSGETKQEFETQNYTAVTGFVPGGSLRDFYEYLRKTGVPCAINNSGPQVWLQNAKGDLLRLPLENTESLELLMKLIWQNVKTVLKKSAR